MSNLTIRIPQEMKKELEEASQQEQRPASEIVRDSLRRYLAIQRFRRVREALVPLAEAQGLLTDEDFFRVPTETIELGPDEQGNAPEGIQRVLRFTAGGLED